MTQPTQTMQYFITQHSSIVKVIWCRKVNWLWMMVDLLLGLQLIHFHGFLKLST